MNIDRPGFEPLDPRLDREVIGAARFETDLGAGAFGVAFADDAEVSSTGRGVFSDLISDGDRGGVLAVGRFFFSDMPVEIIPSVGGCDQHPSLSNCTHRRLCAKNRRRTCKLRNGESC